MPRDGSDTRDRLLRAAEYLFARSGIDVPMVLGTGYFRQQGTEPAFGEALVVYRGLHA